MPSRTPQPLAMTRHLLRHLFLAMLAAMPAVVTAQVSPAMCGGLDNGGNGPFDYRVMRGKELKVVEDYHFNAKVEGLIAGQSGAIGDDLNYVLRVFPNHHRALVSTTRLAKRSKALTAPHMPLSVECYFERALRFKPDDTTARMLFASFLNDLKRQDEAVQQLDKVVEMGKENPFTQYNAGLLFAEIGRFGRALQQAHIAQAMGFAKPDLKHKLQAAGKWVDLPESRLAADIKEPTTANPAVSAASQSGS
jgi:hypothetical protein